MALGFADLDGYLDAPRAVFRGAGRAVREPDRGRRASRSTDGRTALAREQRAQLPARRRARLRQACVGRRRRSSTGCGSRRVSPDGEEGFPGRLEVAVTYTLDASGALRIAYEATTDAPTVVNLTNHTYWNLGRARAARGGHELRIAAVPVHARSDDDLIPTGGARRTSAGTRFDFREARKVGSGYDHNFVLDKGVTERRRRGRRAARPGVRAGADRGDDRAGPPAVHRGPLRPTLPFAPGDGIALETQHFPDSPNRPEFPSTVLRPGEVYRVGDGVRLLGALARPRDTRAPAQGSGPGPGLLMGTCPGSDVNRRGQPAVRDRAARLDLVRTLHSATTSRPSRPRSRRRGAGVRRRPRRSRRARPRRPRSRRASGPGGRRRPRRGGQVDLDDLAARRAPRSCGRGPWPVVPSTSSDSYVQSV